MFKPQKNSTFLVLASTLILLFVGCRATHNQTVIPSEWKGYFNAPPTNKNYLASNQKHKILVAIIDSGVDYNHPLLQEHVHYDLDDSDKAIGAGWDFVGNDSWPLPYLARTQHLYKTDKTTDLKKADEQLTKNIAHLIKKQPELARWLHPHRHHEDEDSQSIYHGTHVAALAAYDDARIGLLPYRILPDQENLDGKLHNTLDYFYNSLEAAITKAHSAGAKVVNLSVGHTFAESENDAKHKIELFKKFEILVNKYPDMIFVAAAGNEGTWVNSETRYSFPCGVKASNMLCVSAVNKNWSPSEFTNIPLISSPLVFAPGEKILSPFPYQYCKSSRMDFVNGTTTIAELDKQSGKILQDCKEQSSTIQPLSGTSMATPIIARAISQLAMEVDPSTPADQIIQAFIGRSEKVQMGPMSLTKFKLPLPSWYPRDAETQGLGLQPNSTRRGYFEFYLNQ